jgi:DtxR family Mn-dependent transcriptional regulator
MSDEFTEYLFDSLGRPETCPHGNPFPGTEMEERLVEARKLSEAVPENTVRVLRITEEGENVPGMLTTCYEHKISPGAEFRVTAISDDSVSLQGGSRKSVFDLAQKLAKHIRVEKVS